jgi:pimeloyl-ACP methyl ester carboxylesterase
MRPDPCWLDDTAGSTDDQALALEPGALPQPGQDARGGWAPSRVVVYASQDERGTPRRNSGRVYLPSPWLHRAAAPLVLYVHASVKDTRDIPLHHRGTEALLGALAAQVHGFAIAMPDLPGFGLDDSGRPHPYCHAQSLAQATLDLVRPALDLLEATGLPWDGRIFLLGYSSGGYGALAALREWQRNPHYANLPIRAAACMAGPFNLPATVRSLFTREAPYAHLEVPTLLFAAYHDLYPAGGFAPEALFNPKLLATRGGGLDEGELGLWLRRGDSAKELNRKIRLRLTGRIDTPLAPSAVMNPDWLQKQLLTPAWPDTEAGRALGENDLVGGWHPTVPVLLATSPHDRWVPAANTGALEADWAARGCPAPIHRQALTVAGLQLGHKQAAILALAKAFRWLKQQKA